MKLNTLFLSLFIAVPTFAQEAVEQGGEPIVEQVADSSYIRALDSLAVVRDNAYSGQSSKGGAAKLNPYFYRLMVPGTYYNNALHQMMGVDWQPDANTSSSQFQDEALNASSASDLALSRLYVSNPSLVKRTENTLREAKAIRKDVEKAPENLTTKLADKAVEVDLDADVAEAVTVEVKKPKFWKYQGSASLQFTQSYFSENWYQGGENNYAGIGMLTAEANYDNKKKVQWDNKFEAQLGFQTATNDEHKARVTSNLLRLTSKLGYKAIKNWYYTGQLMTYTQIAPYYDKNPRKDDGSYDVKPWKARFGTPWYLTLSVGMDWKYKSKNEKFDLSVYLSPVAYYMTYAERLGALWGTPPALNFNERYYGDMYGIMKDADGLYTAHSFHKFGPNFTVNSKIKVMKNILWTSRLYWFSNFHSTLIEWENTVDFTINKYFSAKFYAYPRFDDSSQKYKNAKKHRGDYLMFKEWLSLGLSYKF